MKSSIRPGKTLPAATSTPRISSYHAARTAMSVSPTAYALTRSPWWAEVATTSLAALPVLVFALAFQTGAHRSFFRMLLGTARLGSGNAVAWTPAITQLATILRMSSLSRRRQRLCRRSSPSREMAGRLRARRCCQRAQFYLPPRRQRPNLQWTSAQP